MAGIGKLVLGALLLTMAATAVWRWVKPDANASPRLASALERGLESAAEVSEAKGALSDPTQDSARVALSDRRGGAQDPAASSAAARATEVRLEVSVRDPFGLPVPHATVFAAPLGQAINRIGTTDARGQLAFSWEDETGRTELALAIRGPLGGADILERMTLAAGHENRVERVVEKPMETNVLYADGTFVSLGRFLPFGDPLERAPQALLGEKGRLQFVKETKPLHDHVIQPDLSLDLDFGLPRAEDIVLESELEYVEHQAHAVRGEYAILEIAPPIHVTGHDATLIIETLPADTSAEERPVMGVAKGWVRDADGRPAVHTPVAILTPEGGLLQRRPTDEEGAFHFDGLPDGEYVLRAGGDRNGLASTTFQAHEGRAFQWTGELVRGPQIEGRLTLEGAGTEIPTWEGWSLCASAEEAGIQRQAAASIADDGRFAFPESLGTAATLSVIPPDQSHPIPMTSQRVFAGSTDPISIDPREARPASLSLRVHDEEGVRPRERPRAAVARRLSARHLGPAGRGRERGHGRRVPLLEPARRVLPHRNRRSRTPVADATPTMGRGRGDHRPGPLRAATGGGIGVLRGRDRGMIQN